MHALIWRDRVVDPVRRDEVTQRLESGLLPLLHDLSGVCHSFLITLGEADVACMAVCIDSSSAHAAEAPITQWIGWHVAVLLAGEASIAFGEIVGQGQSEGIDSCRLTSSIE
jgi:hypothetical protein